MARKQYLPVRFEAADVLRRYAAHVGGRQQGVGFSIATVGVRLRQCGLAVPEDFREALPSYYYRPRERRIRLRILWGERACVLTPQHHQGHHGEYVDWASCPHVQGGFQRLPQHLDWLLGGMDLVATYNRTEWQITLSVGEGRSFHLCLHAAPKNAHTVRGFKVFPASPKFSFVLTMLRNEMPPEAFVDWVGDNFPGLVPDAAVSGVRLCGPAKPPFLD